MILNPISLITKYLVLGLSILLLLFLLKNAASSHLSSVPAGCPIPKTGGNHVFHSQYFEDYILSLFFKNIKNGNYIDIGANDPNVDSVTKYFYLKGWRGINIEPIRKHYLELVRYRPKDINLDIGISDQAQDLELFVLSSKNKHEVDVLSTFDKMVLKKAIQDGYSYQSFLVPVKPLSDVLQAHPLKPIHFIKIDVEGMEEKVIHSMDLINDRPWVFIVEAVEPRTHIRSDDQWKKMLLNQHYIYVMFDGLNVYYVAKEHYQALQQSIKTAYACAVEDNKIFPYGK